MSASIIPGLCMLIYFVAVIGIMIFMIRLFVRFVKAVEKIANSVENLCKTKASQSD